MATQDTSLGAQSEQQRVQDRSKEEAEEEGRERNQWQGEMSKEKGHRIPTRQEKEYKWHESQNKMQKPKV